MNRKIIIIRNYLKMCDDLKKYINQDFFPSDLYDVIDIIFFITYTFTNENEYTQIIDDMLEIKNIELDNEKFELVCDIIINFINLIKSL